MKDTISVNNLIEKSGMITHHGVISKFKDKGWKLLISPYYYDNISDSTKEIDIIAERQFNSASIASISSAQINIQLFLECKYIKDEIVLWFDDRDIDKAVIRMEKDSGLGIAHKKSRADITKEKFHYLEDDKVVKIYSTQNNKQDVIYKAITQCLNSRIYYDQWANHPIFFDFSNHPESKNKIIKFPVIVCDNFDKLLNVKFTNEKAYTYDKINNSFELEVNYTYLDKERKAITDYFLIDVLDFNAVDSFLDKLDTEIQSILGAMN